MVLMSEIQIVPIDTLIASHAKVPYLRGIFLFSFLVLIYAFLQQNVVVVYK